MEASRSSLQPFVVRLVLPAMMEKAQELSHLIVVELCLPFLLADKATAADGVSSGASHLLIVILGVVYGVCGL